MTVKLEMNRKRGRKSNVTKESTQLSPIMPQPNGQEFFFTEATFRRVLGPEPSFEEKILARMRGIEKMKAKKKKAKKKPKDLDKPNESDSDAPIQKGTTLKLRDRILPLMDSTFDFVPDQSLELSTVDKKTVSRIDSVLDKITSPIDQSDCLKNINNEAGLENGKNLIVCDVELPDKNVLQGTEPIAVVQENDEATDTKVDKVGSNLDLIQQSSSPVSYEASTRVNLKPGNDLIHHSQIIDLPPKTITSPPQETILSENDDLDKEGELCLVMLSLSDEDEVLEVDLSANPDPSLSSPVPCNTEKPLACEKTCTMNTDIQSKQAIQSSQSNQSIQSNHSIQSIQSNHSIQSIQSNHSIQSIQSNHSIQSNQSVQSNQSEGNTETSESLMDTNVGIVLTADNINNQCFQQLSEDSQSSQYTAWDCGQDVQQSALHLPLVTNVTESQKWSEEDIPIFSVKAHEQQSPSADTRVWDSDHGVQQTAVNLPFVTSSSVTGTQKWSEEDIPIFSVKADEQQSPAAETRKSRRITVCPPEPESSKTASQENVTKASTFKQSNLTREEHAQYLKLYKKYVGAYSQGGLPSVLGSPQMKELAMFEKLQRQVLREQAEFQEYLKQNAERNPKFYQFLREPARNYSSSRIGAYRVQKGYADLFNSSLCDKISLSPGSGCTQMTYHQTLLQVGAPPTIKLPGIPKGKPPIRIPHNMKKIDALFPKFVKKKPPGFIHHEPVSSDVNAKVLAVKHNIQVVMSSSVVSCLFNNQEPGYRHAWNIPVAIEESRFRGKISKVVYLDKPLFEDNLRVRDYNAIFHKYALRAFVSHAKKQDKKAVKIQGFEGQQHKELPSTPLDDPFDMFNSSVTNLETFGTVTSSDKKSLGDKISLPGKNVKTQAKESVEDFNRSLSLDKRLAGSRDGMGNTTHGKVLSSPGENAKLESVPPLVNPLSRSCSRSTQPGKSPAQISLGDKMDTTKQGSPCLMKEALTGLNSDMATSLDNESVIKIPPRTIQQAKQNTSPHVIASSLSDTTVSDSTKVLSPTKEDNQFLHGKRGRKRKYLAESVESHSNSTESNNKEISHHEVASITLDMSSPHSPITSPKTSFTSPKTSITSASLDTSSPLSPISSPPSSPPPNMSVSVHQVVREIPSSPLLHRPIEIPSERVIPLSPNMSVTRTRANNPLHRLVDPTCDGSSNPQCDSHSAVKCVGPLGSILGDTFEDNLSCSKTVVPKEDPSEFVQPLEDCTSLHYNLWSLGDRRVLIRSSCHGIIKEFKKSRSIYLCPKLEYQTAHGLEQLTVDEMVKSWASCYIRQKTNLLRTRINAFTSEILMYEEMEPHKILQPSINFKPHKAFQFLDNLLNHLTRLECGKYLLCHEVGADFCGIKRMSPGSDCRLQRKHYPSRKRRAVDETIPWIPIDPTLLLPFHEEKKRIPATFMPKDLVLENPGKKKNIRHDINDRNKKPQTKNKKKKQKNS